MKNTKRNFKKLAWKEFSINVRFSNLDEHGMATCYTCGVKVDPRKAHAGHFRHGKLDFDKNNVHVQCAHCNCYLHGNLGIYAINLIRELGEEAVDNLILQSNNCKPMKNWEYEIIYNFYKEKNKLLDK